MHELSITFVSIQKSELIFLLIRFLGVGEAGAAVRGLRGPLQLRLHCPGLQLHVLPARLLHLPAVSTGIRPRGIRFMR